ncbi:MAG: metallophosphoesterase [Chitinophagaceae bacterium]|nr:metallophosphoesterase [Chitinophagaceae bacterium]
MPWTRRKFIKYGLGITTGAVLTDALWIEKFFIETNEFFHGNANENTSNIKIVQLSDLHLQSVNYQLKQLAKKLNKLNPSLILITGDAIYKSTNTALLNDFLKLINQDIKKVAILGNWEYWGNVNLTELTGIYNDNNCTLLVNETRQYTFQNKTISITGVDDYLGGKPDINAAIEKYIKSDYHIVLNHCPLYSDTISLQINQDCNIDFILSGHTHGGQVNIAGFTPFLPPGCGRYVKGWYTTNSLKMYVSKGIGASVFPARFGARAEIAVFNLAI